MRFKKLSFFLVLSVLFTLGISSVFASDFVDENAPESWYEAPKTASELGITEFNQAPELEESVNEGNLPEVSERLPKDPPVIEPYNKVGNYGGRVDLFDINLSGSWELTYWNDSATSAGHVTPDGNDMIPWFVEKWEYSNDYKEITLYLREGTRWSNGDLLTADDYLYWWEHYAHNEDLTPVPPEKWEPSLIDLTKEDEYTVTFHYGESNPGSFVDLANHMGMWELAPSEYMKQLHPEFVGMEKVQELAENQELDEWYEYYLLIQDDSPRDPELEHVRPVLTPYVARERTETTLVMERNPYFPFVDTEGNQLPYIDKIRVNLANDQEMAATKAATGEADFAGRNTGLEDMPLYKRNSENENFDVLEYTWPRTTDPILVFNLSHKDDRLREIFQDERFRKAVSLSIDRDNINRKVYFNQGKPMQATISPTNTELYKEEYAEAYAEFDPERAKELLDEMGMVDSNNDGFREGPDGEEFSPTIIYQSNPATRAKTLELALTNWQDVGLDIELKIISRELLDTRRSGNEFDITVDGITSTAGVAFWGKNGYRYLAPLDNPPGYCFGPAWNSWYQSGGESGEEPPAEMKELNELVKTARQSLDENERFEARKKLVETQAEKVWTVGTIGMYTQPIISANKIKNVPQKGMWSNIFGAYGGILHLEQAYIEE